jgi:hypothetical protein
MEIKLDLDRMEPHGGFMTNTMQLTKLQVPPKQFID